VKGRITDFMGLIFIALVIVALVRPSSVGPTAVREFGAAVTGLVKAATAP
jgi:hypothetical protein